jgi:hypothetical protein
MNLNENPANAPYTDAQVSASQTAAAGSGNGPGTGWVLAGNGYANNMLQPYADAGNPADPYIGNPANPTYSPLDLKAADRANINNFWVALNASDYAPTVGNANTSFTMDPAGTPATFCSADPTYDLTDPQCNTQAHGQTTGPCQKGAMVDVKLTEKSIPLFIPLFPGHPTIHAHARVTLQGESSDLDVRPIAVSDPGSFACATVKFKNSFDNSTLGTAQLDETDPANFVFTNTGAAGAPDGPVSFTMPNDLNAQGGNAYVYMQVTLSDCSGNGETFDDTSGIEAINSYGTATPNSGEAPKVTTGGITLRIAGGAGATCGTATTDQYFSAGGCKVQPVANITFSPDVTNPNNQASVTATDTNTGATLTLNPNGAGTLWTPNGNNTGFQIDDFTGQHLIRFDWSQKVGSVGGTACTNQTPCTGSFGNQQQAFGQCDGCDQPDDSGPIVRAQIRLNTDVAGTLGRNAFQRNTATPPLVITLQLAGIKAETNAGAKPVILRFAGSTNHQTGLVDCGQGNGPGGSGTPADAYTIYGGCGPANPFEPAQCNTNGAGCHVPVLNPLFVYGRGNPTDCSPAVDQDYTDWPASNHQDCVQTTPGTRRTGVVCGLLQRITGVTPANFQASSSACNSNIAGETCPTNYWPNYDTLGPNDPRKIDVVLTSPLDLAAAAGSPQAWIPIRRFAKFYVTGWDTSLAPHCGNSGAPNNDPFPAPPGSKVSDNGAIWGHWIIDVDPGGTPNGVQCDTSSGEPTNCVPALTR